MDLRQLRYFQTVAQELNVTRAAARLHMAQPPLSRQIKSLEEDLGVALFDRSERALKLTEAGRFLLEQSLQLTLRFQEMVEGTRRIGQQGRRWFGIGFVPSTLYGFVPELIRRVRSADPQVEVGLSEMTTLQQMDALKAGRIDVGFGRILFDDPAIERTVLMAEPLVAVFPHAHPLLLRKAEEGVTAADLAPLPFVLYPARPRPSYADHVLALFRAAGHTLNIVQEANELQTAIGLVAAGLGVTAVPASVRRLHRDDIGYAPLITPGFSSPVIVSYRRDDRSPFLKQAVALAETLAAAQAG
ncbi:transcriptional regulator CatR [Pigmentiphaga litoralis]|uniref:LysR family transcriptional regulator n=1 Tax=Pigmentiphaga litoralis TaxID=516702 RepID=UPI0016771ABC|nr:LysR family transcriptional regulator [Pigmentiphaga litoralis]GGX17550.1 transcriptional regulator CatR [Pigmentiphaga litoralis]